MPGTRRGSAASDPQLASEQLALSRCLPQVVQMVHKRSRRRSALAFYALSCTQSGASPLRHATAFTSAHARSERFGEVTPEDLAALGSRSAGEPWFAREAGGEMPWICRFWLCARSLARARKERTLARAEFRERFGYQIMTDVQRRSAHLA